MTMEVLQEDLPKVAALHATRVLSLDASGRILDWISWQDAVCLYVRGVVAWTLGDPCVTVRGGISRASGERSSLQLHPIVASTGHCRDHAIDPAPALTNTALFARDRHICLYCGHQYTRHELTRDHVVPLSKKGADEWENVVSACLACNLRKSNRTPQQAHMPLLAVPYRPSWVEHLILSNRNILADQMEFLVSHLPRDRRPA
ncbi:HNH endonuclease [Luteibacter yeojuensis]|jgi:5-methylcytosine-specific restriction endonuclease McrA|uniref:HNH endonuclease n=1 Tax=Luteibacter yeojuensis TaxID=345309 RepID=A0A0F3KHX8_9GAMM|nr:HNH endonuclease [Luteibacter yeojuensis]KJV29714.1 HNH endonuclease [Luteibacter yeojuensis]